MARVKVYAINDQIQHAKLMIEIERIAARADIEAGRAIPEDLARRLAPLKAILDTLHEVKQSRSPRQFYGPN